ncbi:MAG TPA: SMC family ATPase [Blastocatellia bacterium]|nr:SMC family ATPase [Blastocatellia bacterium]
MLITRVELEEIKNYESGSFEFGPGITAISGPNGAGKTTILEAISWALFDHLPYKKEDFLRRGAKKGSVRVTFVSAIDGREYTVYRDTSTGYYIYDPVTKFKLVEQKQQVGGWIKQHLGVDVTTDLKTLFTSTIGVPQGTFTVDFADLPSKRKVSFDRVLRVDEYQKSSEELRSLVRLIESKEFDLREEIARIEGEVNNLDFLMGERLRYETLTATLKDDLSACEAERVAARVEADRLDGLERAIERLGADTTALRSQIESLRQRKGVLEDEVDQSRRAGEAVSASASGFAAYMESNSRIAELEPQVVTRDEIRRKLSEKERDTFQIEAALSASRERLNRIEADRVEVARLEPLVARQEEAEGRRADLQVRIAELAALSERAAAAELELGALRKTYSDLCKRIDEAEGLKELAERSGPLEAEREALEAQLREMRVALERLSERRKDLTRVRESIARLNGELNTLEKEMEAGLEAEEIASSLSSLESRDQEIMEEVAALRASIDRENRILRSIKGGLCPLLSERCLNMNEGQSLDQFFKLQLGTEQQRLTSAERSRQEVQAKLSAARAALKAASSLSGQRVQRKRLKDDLEINRKELLRIEKEIAATAVSEEQVRSVGERLTRLAQEIRVAQDARSRFESLAILRERQEELKTEGAEKRKAFEVMKERLSSLPGLRDEMAQVESRLADLGDPRGRSRLLLEGLKAEGSIRSELESLEARERELAEQVEALRGNLSAFDDLDGLLTAQRIRRASSEKEYRVYIENQPVASLLEARESRLKALAGELEGSVARFEQLNADLERCTLEYDGRRHVEVKARVEELINRSAHLNSEINSAAQRLEELNSEIDKLLASRRRMEELGRTKERFMMLHSVSDFIRDLLKKAGPFITEAHLQSISIESNQLYREITGNPMVSLRWDMGYEIVLEEEGHERSFASLSGGEQMAAALSVRLALLKELSDMRIAFFDEPTTNMDEERRRNLAQQIGRIKDFDQLFVISHDDAFEGFTDRVVSVRGSSDETRP